MGNERDMLSLNKQSRITWRHIINACRYKRTGAHYRVAMSNRYRCQTKNSYHCYCYSPGSLGEGYAVCVRLMSPDDVGQVVGCQEVVDGLRAEAHCAAAAGGVSEPVLVQPGWVNIIIYGSIFNEQK